MVGTKGKNNREIIHRIFFHLPISLLLQTSLQNISESPVHVTTVIGHDMHKIATRLWSAHAGIAPRKAESSNNTKMEVGNAKSKAFPAQETIFFMCYTTEPEASAMGDGSSYYPSLTLPAR